MLCSEDIIIPGCLWQELSPDSVLVLTWVAAWRPTSTEFYYSDLPANRCVTAGWLRAALRQCAKSTSADIRKLGMTLRVSMDGSISFLSSEFASIWKRLSRLDSAKPPVEFSAGQLGMIIGCSMEEAIDWTCCRFQSIPIYRVMPRDIQARVASLCLHGWLSWTAPGAPCGAFYGWLLKRAQLTVDQDPDMPALAYADVSRAGMLDELKSDVKPPTSVTALGEVTSACAALVGRLNLDISGSMQKVSAMYLAGRCVARISQDLLGKLNTADIKRIMSGRLPGTDRSRLPDVFDGVVAAHESWLIDGDIDRKRLRSCCAEVLSANGMKSMRRHRTSEKDDQDGSAQE